MVLTFSGDSISSGLVVSLPLKIGEVSRMSKSAGNVVTPDDRDVHLSIGIDQAVARVDSEKLADDRSGRGGASHQGASHREQQ